MKVTCTGRRVTLKPSFIENAEKRLAKLDKFFPDEAQAQVTVTVEKSGQTVEIMLRSKDLAMRAEKTNPVAFPVASGCPAPFRGKTDPV